jgi:3-isopropylmalate/(R)-2-methylmalate dehydratase small subunit
VFADDRAALQGSHPFDLPQYQGAKILVVNGNFGCGSSREHAPQAILRWGIQAIIGESFAEIFFGNCIANGVPCVTADAKTVQHLQDLIEANPEIPVDFSLATMTVELGDFVATVSMNEGSRQMLIEGSWDTCGQLLQNIDLIQSTAQKLPYLSFP